MFAIVNVNEDWAIGKDGKLLCKFKEDTAFFKKNTKGSAIVCGRKTFNDFPNSKPLSGRTNIVLSRDPVDALNWKNMTEAGYVCRLERYYDLLNLSIANSSTENSDTSTIIAKNVRDILEYAKFIENMCNICICGGQYIYEQFLPYCEYCLVTINNFKCENPTSFFPNLDKLDNWEVIKSSSKEISKDDKFKDQNLTYQFVHYRNKSPKEF